ncbi:MAG TPA: DNA polymerase III subunit gamma/tau [Flavobacteriales bacterium]|jgi:DNA polymerase-3 subunit gamma/tau|nr:DNA polymerase III subunit gamma/tau [Flavobacteriales bacterium]
MERFIVSARKYRPALFDTVVGQEAVTGTLKNAIKNNHLASAFLFTGPRGVGKTTCARILARTINCENLGEDLVPCGQCAPCITFEEGHSLNIFELDAASNNSVDDIRNLILQVQIAPQVGTKKVYIIDEVHMLSTAAFNAFLKTLEEPPSYAIFILATTEKHKILPTILSRCQVFDFRRITVGDIAKHLASIAEKEGIQAEPLALHTIAQKADGGLRDALSIFDQLVSFAGQRLTYADVVKNLNVLDHEHYFRLTDQLLNNDTAGALVEFNTILFQGFDGHLFVTGLAKHFRDLLVSQDARTIPLLEVSDDLGARYAQQAQATPRDLLVRGLERLGQVDTQYKNSKEPRLLVELALIQLAALRAGNGAAVADASAEAQKKSPDVSVAPPKAPAPPPALSTGQAGAPVERPVMPPVSVVAEPMATMAPPPPPAPSAPARRLAVGISINRTMEQPSAVAAASLVVDAPGMEPETSADAPPRVLNLSLLLMVWKEYALARKREGKSSLHATLVAREPMIAAPRAVSFTIVNEVQENYMREEKPTLLGHLRRELGDPGLELNVIKEEITNLRPRYTPKDKFNILAEKNPALLKLRDALDLDLG